MSGPDYGKLTGQHTQPRQQAELMGCCDEPLLSIAPPALINCDARYAHLLLDMIDSTFRHADRIHILEPGEWRTHIEAEEDAAFAARVEAREEFLCGYWADLEIEGG